jgi:hypothetical protein
MRIRSMKLFPAAPAGAAKRPTKSIVIGNSASVGLGLVRAPG